MNDKENMVIDKIVNFMLEDTRYKIKTIKDEPVARIVYPFYVGEIFLEDWNGCDYHLNYMGDYPLDDEGVNYISNQYGITDTSIILEIFNRYIKILFTKIQKEIEDFGDDSLNESDIILKESDDRRKNYLDKVLEFIINDTQIEPHAMWPSEWINISVPFTNLVYSRIIHFDREDFFDYCRDTYGLTKDESYNIWEDYVYEINQTLKNEWGISDPVYH